MGMEMGIGLIIGVLLIWIGYIVRTKGIYSLLAGFWITWEPVNNEKLGNRIGILFIILGIFSILTAVFTIWFGATVGKVSGVLALIDVIMIIIAIGYLLLNYHCCRLCAEKEETDIVSKRMEEGINSIYTVHLLAIKSASKT